MQIVRFHVSGKEIAFPVSHVREVVPVAPLALVFNTPPLVEGLMNVRGEAVPVFNLARLFSLPESSAEGRLVIIVESGHLTSGFLADPPVDIFDVAPGARDKPPEGSPILAALDRVLMLDDRAVLLLDPEKLFDLAQMVRLRREAEVLSI